MIVGLVMVVAVAEDVRRTRSPVVERLPAVAVVAAVGDRRVMPGITNPGVV